jgi:hypothetical protein
MRMWLVNPRLMCRQHLLGEHVEMHMFVGHIRLGRKLGRYASEGMVDTRKIQARHDQLVAEMGFRGYDHKSPMNYADKLAEGRVNKATSLQELLRRCPECGRRQNQKRSKP